MHYSISTENLQNLTTDCLIIARFEENEWAFVDVNLPEKLQAELEESINLAGFKASLGNLLPLVNLAETEIPRILILGLGKKEVFNNLQLRSAFQSAIKWCSDKNFDKASIALPSDCIKFAVEGAGNALYSYTVFKSQAPEPLSLEKIEFIVIPNQITNVQEALSYAIALVEGMNFCKDLGNAPSNVMTPEMLKNISAELANNNADVISCEILDREQMTKLGMNTLLSVAKGSNEPPYLIKLEYKYGKVDSKPIVLVGKGVTFDSGGISLKPGEGMDEMKYDMCGAASVLGTFKALSELKVASHVIGLIPTVENMPSGNAAKPGDIVKTMNGLTVENLNTDAEGRLILCDALTYAERFEPRAVIDIATLTGAIIIALGRHPHGLFANNQDLADAIKSSAESSGDRVWQLPLWDDYKAQLDSNFADMANIGGREGGSITAAVFLSQFAEKYNWAHLDIAGTAWKSGKEKGATARPIPLLLDYIYNNLS